jgi:hypothetical protein
MKALFLSILGWIGRRYWISRIDSVLRRAKQDGRLNSWLLHELDGKLKYGDPLRPWSPRPEGGTGGRCATCGHSTVYVRGQIAHAPH